MDFASPTSRSSKESIAWSIPPHCLQALSFITIASITADNYISDIDVATPGVIPYFLFEGMDLQGHTLYIISDGMTWQAAKQRRIGNLRDYHIAATQMHLTTYDQDLIKQLIKIICDDAIQDCKD